MHKVARNPADPDQLFAQNHGGVFRSDDAGLMWSEISEGLPASFGFPVLANPHRPGTVYVFPLVADVERFPPGGAMAIWRSTDAGRNWHALTDGLPQSGVYTAVLRDAACVDDIDSTGIYFGTRSGRRVRRHRRRRDRALQLIAENLPDVLSIRAATVG